MILYHGSNIAVEKPKILQSDRRLDFGTGFYLTSSYEQAERWAFLTVKRRGAGQQIITSYDFNEEMLPSLKVTKFDGATEDWLKFVANNRNVKDFIENSDIVIGPVANDRTMPVIKMYFAGIYDEAEAIKRLLPQKLKDQYAFKSEKALNALTLSEVIVR
ncbi:MAG: DUF3990 domain-containing protein [Peptococcaceae bacterium]